LKEGRLTKERLCFGTFCTIPQSYLPRENTTVVKPIKVTISRIYASDIDYESTLSSLGDEGKGFLSKFIGELGLLGLLSYPLVYKYHLKLMHSISIPSPSASELEAFVDFFAV